MIDAPGLTELEAASRLAVSSLIGLAIGLEREWSGHASGRRARFAGLRTFMMLGMLGGLAGVLSARGGMALAGVMVAAGFALAVVAYYVSSRATGDLDGTTEVAAALVISLGITAGSGWLMLSSAAGAIVVLALSEKERLHELVGAIGAAELNAGLRFAVLAIVVLPVLPRAVSLGPVEVRPRALWTIVLALCALNFATYMARRAVGARRGYGIAGAIGGLLSSTAVTLAYSRRSRGTIEEASSLATGVIAACTVLVPRVIIVSGALHPGVALAALPYLAPVLVAGVLMTFAGRTSARGPDAEPAPDRSPLRFLNALQMAIAFQLSLTAIAWIRPRLGDLGIYGAAVALGLTDMDALTVSMSSRSSLIDPAIAGRALAVGLLANTVFKLGITLVVGGPEFRRRTVIALGSLAAVSALALIMV